MIFEKARWIAFFRTGNGGSGIESDVKLISNLCVFLVVMKKCFAYKVTFGPIRFSWDHSHFDQRV